MHTAMEWGEHTMNRLKTAIVACILLVAVSCAAFQGLTVLPDPNAPTRGTLFYELINRSIEWLRIQENSNADQQIGWVETLMRGLIETLDDPYSEYMDEAEFDNFMTDMVGTFGGVGVVIAQEGEHTLIVRLLDDGAAEKAGLLPGDRIIRLNGDSVVGKGLDFTAALLKGDPGSPIQVGILREDGREYTYNLVREIIRVNTVEASIVDNKYGYVYISLFNEHTSTNLADVLNDFARQKIQGVVIDLRDNPGGLLDQGIETARMLVPAGPVVHVVSRTGKKETYYSEGPGLPWPLVVLVNGGTASASEIVAGAVKDREAGLLVGTPTYGKGSVQSVFNFGLGGVKITMANYLTPNEYSIEGDGIVPDYMTYPRISGTDGRVDTVPAVYTLELGDQNSIVSRMQKILIFLGYDTETTVGVFDERTQKALIEFQRDAGLPPTGIADTQTLSRLNYALLSHSIPTAGDTQLRKAIAVLEEQNLH